MLATTRTAVVLREEILKDVVGGFSEDGVRRDQHRHTAETVRANFRAGEGRDRRDVAQRGGAQDNVLEDELPGSAAGIDLDLRVAAGYGCQALGDVGGRGVVDSRGRFERCPGVVDRKPVAPFDVDRRANGALVRRAKGSPVWDRFVPAVHRGTRGLLRPIGKAASSVWRLTGIDS
jgi:hypothetical protein